MATAKDRVLYIGTTDGVYRAEPNGDDDYRVQTLGLQGQGMVRAPVLADRDDPRRLFAGTNRGGMFRSEDGGESWKEINQGIIYKEVWSLAQHPQSGEIVVGTGPASVFKSTDKGESWNDCEQLRTLPETKEWTFPNPPHIAHVKGLDLNGSRILGAVEEGWVIRSTDNGQTWQDILQGTHFDSHYVVTMPDSPEIVISTSGHGVYRSQDGGQTFVDWGNGLDCVYMAQVVVHPARPNVLFTAAAEVPPPGWRRPEGANTHFFRSENQGAKWERVTGGLPEHFKAAPRAVVNDPEDPDALFVGMTDGSVWMSEDGGDSFRQIVSGLNQVQSLRVARR
jgi:photosystem II stability/assembly factor-like uncharacterized protein